jgi:hypothetical protein
VTQLLGCRPESLEYWREIDMPATPRLLAGAAASAIAVLLAFAADATATAPPVGPLPAGPTSAIETVRGELVAVALPRRGGGRTWRIARAFDAAVAEQISEADVGNSVVLVFRTTGRGRTVLRFGLTRGERAKAYESRTVTVRVD